jgi:hypothetical protein
MGFFSWNCKECDHSVLSEHSTDPEINAWMKDAVVLGPGGDRVLGEYDGYGNVGGHNRSDLSDSQVWLHLACWEVAGKPEFDRYGEGSGGAGDQGFFFGKEHDLIDPRISDPDERVRLLAEGIETRDKRWYDGRARDVAHWMDDFGRDEDEKVWSQRFSFGKCREEGRRLEDGKWHAPIIQDEWYINDKWGPEEAGLGETQFHGKHAELLAHIDGLWAAFAEGPECAAYLSRAKEMSDEAQARYVAKVREEGRYEVTYKPSQHPTDMINGRGMSRSMYYVKDKLAYGVAAIFDWPTEGDLAGREFSRVSDSDPDSTFEGTVSPEWEERIPKIQEAHRDLRLAAEESALRFNEEWRDAGYPEAKTWTPGSVELLQFRGRKLEPWTAN